MQQSDSSKRLLAALVGSGLLSKEDEGRAQKAAELSGDSVTTALARLGLVSEEALAETLSDVFSLPRVTTDELGAAELRITGISLPFLKRARALPISAPDELVVRVAMADITDDETTKAIELFLAKPVAPLVALATDLDAALERLSGGAIDPAIETRQNAHSEEIFLGGLSELDRLREAASDAPVIRFVNSLLARAVDEHASDIHLEPTAHGLTIRFRIDGRLRRREPSAPVNLRDAILSRIKLMAALDIAEHRLPQDGRISFAVRGQEIDFRVATAPTGFGESIVIRVLDRAQIRLDFSDLGFDDIGSTALRGALSKPNGMVLVTGPTGSGKTTTLYAALSALNSPEFKLMTVEDPIEYHLPGVQQVQVNPAIGLTFARALRSFLRHNPNIVMVGEIRDRETADIAVQVALTGHLLLSTLHTNDAASGVARLLDIGVEDYLIASTCNAIAAQRLVRTLCPHCKRPKRLTDEEASQYGLNSAIDQLFTSGACASCNHAGFSGRTTIVEVLHLSDAIRDLVLRRAATSEIAGQARRDGMRSMYEHGLRKVAAGVTTIEEVLGAVRSI